MTACVCFFVFFCSLLLELYTFKPFTDQMNPRKELRRQLEKCIEPSVDSWFSMLKRTVMPSGGVRNNEIVKFASDDKIFFYHSLNPKS